MLLLVQAPEQQNDAQAAVHVPDVSLFRAAAQAYAVDGTALTSSRIKLCSSKHQ